MNPQDTLNEILSVLQLGASAAQQVGNSIGNPDVQGGAAIAALLLSITQKAISAYEMHQGQPIDLSLLHRVEPAE